MASRLRNTFTNTDKYILNMVRGFIMTQHQNLQPFAVDPYALPPPSPSESPAPLMLVKFERSVCPRASPWVWGDYSPTLIVYWFHRWWPSRSSGGKWRACHPGQREREEDPKTPIHVFIFATSTIGTPLSKNPIFRITRPSSIGC